MSNQDTGRNARTYILSLINTMDVAELDGLIGVGLEDRERRPSLDETRVLEEDRQDDEEDWEPMSKGQLEVHCLLTERGDQQHQCEAEELRCPCGPPCKSDQRAERIPMT